MSMAVGKLSFTKFILWILTAALALPAFAEPKKPSPAEKPAAPCVTDILTDKLSPQQMEILKAFENLFGGPVAPSQWKSGDTAVDLEAVSGKIRLTVSAFVPEKCERLSAPGRVIDYVQKFDDYINAGIKAGGLKYAVKLCRDDNNLYIDPSFYGIRINVAPGQSPSSVALNLILPSTASCKDEVTKVAPATN